MASHDHYDRQLSAILVAGPGGRADGAIEALAGAGVRLRARLDLADAVERLGEQAAPDLLVVEARGATDVELDALLTAAAVMRRAAPMELVASVGLDGLDVAAAHLLGSGAQLLCDATAADRAVAVALACARATGEAPARVRSDDLVGESDAIRLQRLSEAVVRIAEALSQLTRDEGIASMLREPGADYGAEDSGPPPVNANDIRAVIRARRMRAQFFADELFADPAWDMLLDLYAAQLEDRRVSVSSLCIAAAVPPTTALRWIGTLHDAGLFERRADPSDRRRAYVALSTKGLRAMREYVTGIRSAGLHLV